jgi:hypothetical protein
MGHFHEFWFDRLIGKAMDCKSINSGSIPLQTFTLIVEYGNLEMDRADMLPIGVQRGRRSFQVHNEFQDVLVEMGGVVSAQEDVQDHECEIR